MPPTVIYSVIESPAHRDFSALYDRLGLQHRAFTSMRKAIAELKKHPPDLVIAEYFYGYGNNYAGINVSNLDVFLHSLRKYAPGARVLLMVDKAELIHLDKLRALFDIHGVLVHPVGEQELSAALRQLAGRP